MIVTHDYKMVNNKLIEKGYGELTVNSLHFDRFFTEEEKLHNVKQSNELTTSQWNERCEEVSKFISSQMKIVIEQLSSKYDIHQLTEETSTGTHYNSNWDLFFWSNKGWNNKDYFDTFSLSINDKRSVLNNINLVKDIVAILSDIKVENVCCRVQYKSIMNDNKILEDGHSILKNLTGQVIEYKGMNGRIKPISSEEYGFFKKGASRTYYPISNEYAVLCLQ